MTPQFEQALAAMDRGDVPALEHLLAEHPGLVRERAEHPEEYFRRPFLLWFVAENPVRHGRLPANIADAARVVVEAARRERVDTLQVQLDYALALVCSGRVPRESGVQQALIDALADAGADVTEALEPALAHREHGAVEHLLRRGARPTLALAASRGQASEVARRAPDASPRDLQAGLIAAASDGQAPVIPELLRHGAQLDGYGPDGFHPHATALHQAVAAGSLAVVRTLVEAGAALTLKDSIHDGTPLDWAEYLQRPEIAAYLKEKQASGPPAAWTPRRWWPLFVRPSAFFNNRALLDRDAPALAAAYLLGVLQVADSVVGRAESSALGRTWLALWAAALLLGPLAAALYWWIGGLWFQLRLRWSGAAAADPRLSRLVLMNGSLVYGLPALAALLSATVLHPTPGAALQSGWLYAAAAFVFWPWSCVTLYRGARTVFPVKRGRAAFWLIGLPMTVWCLSVAAVFVEGLRPALGIPD
jgi:peptide-methionine (S)-S-oxide reductase